MRQAIVLWWHRRVLGHHQESVMNGATEPGVRCYCPIYSRPAPWMAPREGGYRPTPRKRFRWFPSDGGGGK